MKSIAETARLAGVSTRTLRFYDEIGLVNPRRNPANGYREYDEAQLLRLQQVLFYRELGFELDKIRELLSQKDFDPLTALYEHRRALDRKLKRLSTLRDTVDRSIAMLRGETVMKAETIFAGFSEEQQEAYAREAETKYDPAKVRESNARWKAYGPEKQKEILAESSQVYVDFAAQLEKGTDPAAPVVQELVGRWRKSIEWFWKPELEQLLPLARSYDEDPAFKATIDGVREGLAVYIAKAVEAYVAGSKS